MRAIQCRLTSSWSDIKGLAVDPLFLGMGMNVRIVDLVLGLTSRGRGLEGSQRCSCMQWVIIRPRDGGLAHRQISRRSLGAKPNCTGRDAAADDDGGHGGMASSLVESSVCSWVWC